MSRFFESICWSNGKYHNLPGHQDRMNRTMVHFYGKKAPELKTLLPNFSDSPKRKIRVIYSNSVEQVEHELYELRRIERLRLVHDDMIDYSFKFTDRTSIDKHEKDEKEEILFIRDGLITDSTYANIALWNGQKWVTPSTPLLKGVRRESLLAAGRVFAEPVHVKDLPGYSKIALINAMIDLGEMVINTTHLISR